MPETASQIADMGVLESRSEELGGYTFEFTTVREDADATPLIPHANMGMQFCLRAADGIVLVDSCPSREVFEAFATGDGFRELRERHGLPEPERLADFPVHAAFVDGAQRAVEAVR